MTNKFGYWNAEMRAGAIADALYFLDVSDEGTKEELEAYEAASVALLNKKYTRAVDILENVITCTSCDALRSICDGVASRDLKVRIYQVYNAINEQLPIYNKALIW